MLQPNIYLPDAVKQEPISPRYGDLSSPSPQHQRYTPSPNQLPTTTLPSNQLPSTSMSLNIPAPQSHYDMNNYSANVSPNNANMLNVQYSTQANQHSNIPNASVFTEAGHFLNNNSNPSHQTEQRNIEDIFMNNNLNNINPLDNVTNTNQVAEIDSSGMNISSLLNLDSQNQINSSFLSHDFSDILRKLDNGDNQDAIPILIDAIQPNQEQPDEENMTDSFKNISIE